MNGVRGGWHHPGVQMLVVLVLVIAAATIATTVSTSRASACSRHP